MGLVLDIKITGDEICDVLHQVIWGERVALVQFEICKEKKKQWRMQNIYTCEIPQDINANT